jgi:hypothetical protein
MRDRTAWRTRFAIARHEPWPENPQWPVADLKGAFAELWAEVDEWRRLDLPGAELLAGGLAHLELAWRPAQAPLL